MEDWELLNAYIQNGSEQAFRTLVGRYAAIVYSAALRQVGDPHHAEDIAQTVFALLARKAGSIPKNSVIVGWLHRTTCYVAADQKRAEQRRRMRETKAASMEFIDPVSENDWKELAPMLDQAILQLGEKDQQALLLRFFQQKRLDDIGRLLGISEDAAKMRVNRAVEKLRVIFARNGITVTGVALTALLTQNSVQAVPPGMVVSIGAAALLASSSMSVSVLTSVKWFTLMAKLKTQTAAVTALAGLIALSGGYFLFKEQAASQKRWLASGDLPDLTRQNFNETFGATGALNAFAKANNVDNHDIKEALAALHVAIYDLPSSRRIPFDRVTEALRKFGTRRREAAPMLMEALRSPRQSIAVIALAAHGLTELGPDAEAFLPELLQLHADNKLGILNDALPKLFLGVHPKPDLIPMLLPIFSNPQHQSRFQTGEIISELALRFPDQMYTYRSDLEAMLDGPARLEAAAVLAKLPGSKNDRLVPVLVSLLNIAALTNPDNYQPQVVSLGNDYMVGYAQKSGDDFTRRRAAGILASLGSSARSAIPALDVLLARTDDPHVRIDVMRAIGTIAPDRRSNSAEIDRIVVNHERGNTLFEAIQSGKGDFDSLVEGLQYERSVHLAASAIGKLDKQKIKTVLPELRAALNKWGDYDVAQVLKQHDSQAVLIEALQNPKAAYEAASTLGELGAEAKAALPALWEALEKGPADSRLAVAAAITTIDPGSAKPIFGHEDLFPAVTAMMESAETMGGEDYKRVQNVFIEYGQDLNEVTRGRVAEFARSVKEASPQIYGAFISKLIASNPDLKRDLQD